MPPARPLISFLSDFGLLDPYAGTVKGVILGICPNCAIVDVTHAVTPQNVSEAVFLARQAWPYFADGAVHLAVVDPGVGTERPAVALRTPRGYAVGPDNGVLSAALDGAVSGEEAGGVEPRLLSVPGGCEARELRSDRVIRGGPSATFHGRDIFGPAAAWLATGFPFAELGPKLERVWYLPVARAQSTAAGPRGVVVHVDRFGNLITSIRAADLPSGVAAVAAAGRRLPLVRTYGDQRELCALIGSGGYLEIALPNGSAADALAAGVGLEVSVPAP
ncbi:MAG TPA: SAM-dependent chlorinase/fluorinase [Dehalococcoidia bacterium]|nr:SAM-dependent chlorinase/fluorinase [Dehalococcoidia bacterium]